MNAYESTCRKEKLKGYILAADLLPERLWEAVFSIPQEMQMYTEEFRLRVGQPLTLTVDGKVYAIHNTMVQAEDIEAVLAKATRCSVHSSEEQMRQGFITARNGCRIGLCGTYSETVRGAVLRDICAINLRIARQHRGIGQNVLEKLFPAGNLCSVLVISPPGVGKTTLLRDLSQILSKTHRIAVADCRCELSGEQFDLGLCDVMQGGHKTKIIEMLTRTMSPEMIVIDEITASSDIEAIKEAGYTGVSFLAAAHGGSLEDLQWRPLYRELIETEIFRKIVVLERSSLGRTYRIMERSSADDKDHWIDHDRNLLLDDGNFHAEGIEET